MRASPQNHHVSQGKNRARETSDAVETKEDNGSVASVQQALAGTVTLPANSAQRQGHHDARLDGNPLAHEDLIPQEGKVKTATRHPIDELIEVAADEDKTRLAEAASIWKEIAELREQQKGDGMDTSSLDAALRVAADQTDQASSGNIRSGRTDYAADQTDQASSGNIRSGRTDYAADQTDQASSGNIRSGRTDYAADQTDQASSGNIRSGRTDYAADQTDSHTASGGVRSGRTDYAFLHGNTAVGSSDDDATNSSTTDVVMFADVLHSNHNSLDSYLPPSPNTNSTQVAQTMATTLADGPHNGSTNVCLDVHSANQQVLQELLQPKELPVA